MGKKPDLDIICLGPNLLGVHTPDERMDIESVQRTWEYVKAVLAACK
jgi:dipeptidase D